MPTSRDIQASTFSLSSIRSEKGRSVTIGFAIVKRAKPAARCSVCKRMDVYRAQGNMETDPVCRRKNTRYKRDHVWTKSKLLNGPRNVNKRRVAMRKLLSKEKLCSQVSLGMCLFKLEFCVHHMLFASQVACALHR